jgi:hypothetical protein
MGLHFSYRERNCMAALAALVLASLACSSSGTPAPLDVSSIQTAAFQTALAAIQLAQTPGAGVLSLPQTIAPAPIPTQASWPEAAAVTVTGNGDSVQDVSAWPQIPGLMRVQGNAAGRFFAIIPYDQSGNRLVSALSSTEPYSGIVPFNFNAEYATRLEIQATDSWAIQILPLSQARVLTVPGAIQGSGDEVIVLAGGTPDTASVSGNSASRFFAVIPYERNANRLFSVVSSTEPYEGTVIVDRSAAILEIQAIGDWSIQIATAP